MHGQRLGEWILGGKSCTNHLTNLTLPDLSSFGSFMSTDHFGCSLLGRKGLTVELLPMPVQLPFAHVGAPLWKCPTYFDLFSRFFRRMAWVKGIQRLVHKHKDHLQLDHQSNCDMR